MRAPILHPLVAAILAFVLAPLVPAIFVCLYAIITGGKGDVSDAAMLVLAFYSFAEMFAIFIGMPTIFVMRYFWKITLKTTLFAGFSIGIVGGMLLNSSITRHLDMTLFCGFYGLFSAYVFWKIWSLRIGHPLQSDITKQNQSASAQ